MMNENILNVLSEEAFMDKTTKIISALYTIASKDSDLDLDSPKSVQNLVRAGNGGLIPAGDTIATDKLSKVTAVFIQGNTRTNLTINTDKFLIWADDAGASTYEFIFDGAVWKDSNDRIVGLSQIGITLAKTPVADDKITVVTESTSEVFDVVGHDSFEPVSSDLTHTLVLLNQKLVTRWTIPFNAGQLMYYTDTQLPAGTYKFTLDAAAYGGNTTYDGSYMFTTTKPIPANGGFRHDNIGQYSGSGYSKSDVLGNHIITYSASPYRTVVESGLTVTEWTEGATATDLGTFTYGNNTSKYSSYYNAGGNKRRNCIARQRYGSNRYAHSALRQWLNSDASSAASDSSNWWVPQSVFDMPPGNRNLAGYLYHMDPQFKEVICPVNVTCRIPEVDVAVSGQTTVIKEILRDKVWLPSITNIFGKTWNNAATLPSGSTTDIWEDNQFEYYDKAVTSGSNLTIKYYDTTPYYWWLRSAFPGYPYIVRGVYASGALVNNSAYNNYGVVPGLCIG